MSRLVKPVSKRDHIRGRTDAPIELVEYGDYECPYSGRAYPIVKSLREALGDRLVFVFRNFPLTHVHPHALAAAQTAEAAQMQGRFWEMHDLLFEEQQSLEDEALLHRASELELDVERFVRDFPRTGERIQEDVISGERSGVTGTPSFYINGDMYEGNWTSVRAFLGALEAAGPPEGVGLVTPR